ncbi:hypothetical protein [Polymorphospora lycopeni]|uniref:Uncharacterized protein n=1 Tax=Polymorphospora lycopeni TaxID=3140240 RepID=A0ABV5CL44_9ACTN
MPVTDFRTQADAIAYALGEPATHTEWAVAYHWPNHPTTHSPTVDRQAAAAEAEDLNLAVATVMLSGRLDPTYPTRTAVAYRETRVLPDGTQIISPWKEN